MIKLRINKSTFLKGFMLIRGKLKGYAEMSSWVDENDGILVFDKNNDGIINDGGEIFGDQFVLANGQNATSGFNALKSLDSDNNNIINANDAEFADIKILKGDGTIITLEEAGIVSINLNSTNSNTTDENGNIQLSVSSYTKTDNTTYQIGDYLLNRDTVHSVSTNQVEVSNEIAALWNFRKEYRLAA